MTIYKFDDEIQINQAIGHFLGTAQTAALADGGWVVTWTDGDSDAIFQKRYDKDGSAIQVSDQPVSTGGQGVSESSVAALPDGGWVVTWRVYDLDGTGTNIYQRIYDASGQPTSPTKVNVADLGPQERPSVTVLSDGSWVVTWTSLEASQTDIYERHFASDGTALTGDIRVNSVVEGNQDFSKVAALSDGGWVVTWSAAGQDGMSDVYQRRYQADGTPVPGGDRVVNTVADNRHQEQSVVGLSDGGWIVTWKSIDVDSTQPYQILQQKFDQAGNPVWTSDKPISASDGSAELPSVAALADGGWVVSWDESNSESDGLDIFTQAFDQNGVAVTPKLLTNTTAAYKQTQPSAAALADGGWVVAWDSFQNITDHDMYLQRFSPNQGPKGLFLNGAVNEGAQSGVTDVTLTASDVNVGYGDSLTYALIDDAGGLFALDGNKLTVKDGTKLDYEQAASHMIVVRVTDADGLSLEKTLTVKVTDVARENVVGTANADKLVGGSDTDTFDGKAGNDTLIGGGGADTLIGGSGDDTLVGAGDAGTAVFSGTKASYSVVKSTDGSVTVTGPDGTDLLTDIRFARFDDATVDLAALTPPAPPPSGGGSSGGGSSGGSPAPSGPVALTLRGTSRAERLTGADGSDTIKGMAGNDVLKGLGGDDRLYGGAGKDSLYGGAGKDVFVFDAKFNKKTNFDKIADFSVKDDTLWLENSLFKANKTLYAAIKKGKEAKPAKLASKFFRLDKAKDKNDHFIYDRKKGVLSYDDDGIGSHKAVEIAMLKKNLKLTYHDFYFI